MPADRLMRVACLQLCSGRDVAANLARVERLLSQAAESGATLAILPENFAFMGGSVDEKRRMAQDGEVSAILGFLSDQARRHQMAIVGGSLLMAVGKRRLHNSCPVFDASGAMLAGYAKMHLFDVTLDGEHYGESELVTAGESPVMVELNGFKVGLSICYDLRFPELYRYYSAQGCEILCNVAAFTRATGQAHWRTLLGARAIENQCYMLAAAQWGRHLDGRESWGESMVIDPWGEVVGEFSSGEGVLIADISARRVSDVRRTLPALNHRRM